MTYRQAPEVRGEMNLMKLFVKFGTDDECRAYMQELRWPDGVWCPRCDSTKISRMYKRNQFDCDSCGYQFSVTAGTIFHDSHLPLPKWFAAIYLICESKKGMSSNQLKRTLQMSYKTAWYLTHRIRAAMAEAFPEPLTGIVEVDETFVGGKAKNMHKADRARKITGRGGESGNKTMVVGMMQRGGTIRFRITDRRDRATLHALIREHVADDAEAIFTDEHAGYVGIGDEDTRHESVNHSAEEWVRADVHTNTVEGLWSLFKRSIVGSYHQLSAKHMNAYLDEMAFRFNNRENPYLFRDTLLKLIASENLPYQQLVQRSVAGLAERE